jgi:hypothetical protein
MRTWAPFAIVLALLVAAALALWAFDLTGDVDECRQGRVQTEACR